MDFCVLQKGQMPFIQTDLQCGIRVQKPIPHQISYEMCNSLRQTENAQTEEATSSLHTMIANIVNEGKKKRESHGSCRLRISLAEHESFEERWTAQR